MNSNHHDFIAMTMALRLSALTLFLVLLLSYDDWELFFYFCCTVRQHRHIVYFIYYSVAVLWAIHGFHFIFFYHRVMFFFFCCSRVERHWLLRIGFGFLRYEMRNKDYLMWGVQSFFTSVHVHMCHTCVLYAIIISKLEYNSSTWKHYILQKNPQHIEQRVLII